MENIIMESAYVNYEGRVQIDSYIIIVSLWNKFLEEEGREENKVYLNNKGFFKNSFDTPYDAAQAASAGDYRWTDDFVYIDTEGYLMSFSRLDDETCPIDIDRIDIGFIIRSLKDLEENDKRYVVNNIPRAIHDALKED